MRKKIPVLIDTYTATIELKEPQWCKLWVDVKLSSRTCCACLIDMMLLINYSEKLDDSDDEDAWPFSEYQWCCDQASASLLDISVCKVQPYPTAGLSLLVPLVRNRSRRGETTGTSLISSKCEREK